MHPKNRETVMGSYYMNRTNSLFAWSDLPLQVVTYLRNSEIKNDYAKKSKDISRMLFAR